MAKIHSTFSSLLLRSKSHLRFVLNTKSQLGCVPRRPGARKAKFGGDLPVQRPLHFLSLHSCAFQVIDFHFSLQPTRLLPTLHFTWMGARVPWTPQQLRVSHSLRRSQTRHASRSWKRCTKARLPSPQRRPTRCLLTGWKAAIWRPNLFAVGFSTFQVLLPF